MRLDLCHISSFRGLCNGYRLFTQFVVFQYSPILSVYAYIDYINNMQINRKHSYVFNQLKLTTVIKDITLVTLSTTSL